MKAKIYNLKDAYRLFDFERNWDDEDALPLNPKSFNRAMLFIHYLLSLSDKIPLPDISLNQNGDVDLLWMSDFRYRLLVTVNHKTHEWYGQANDGSAETKGENEFGILNNNLIHWIAQHIR